MLEDRLLVWRLKQASGRAVRRLYDKYEEDLLTLAANLLGDAHQAEDVLQDVFMKFVESIDTFEVTGSLRSYLATCVANRSRDYRRRVRGWAGEPIEAAQRVESERQGPLARAVAGDQQQRLATALAELPHEQREAVLLHLQGSLKFREIAEAQNVSAKTAESRYRYGLNKLRSALNSEIEK
jgi:RNA polymerase sigma-70 factor (ECF subfamily)